MLQQTTPYNNTFALDLKVSQEILISRYGAVNKDKDLFSSGYEEDNLYKEKTVLLEEPADEHEIARTKRFSFGQSDNRTEIDNEQSFQSAQGGSVHCQEAEDDWLRVDYFDPLDMQKQESMENNFNEMTMTLNLETQISQESMQQPVNFLTSRKCSEDNIELEVETIRDDVSVAPLSQEQDLVTDNVCPLIITNVREVPLMQVPEVQQEAEATPAFVHQNEGSSVSSSSLDQGTSTAIRYRHNLKRSMIDSRFEMTMNNRRRKTDDQVDVLVAIFDKHDGKPSREMKDEAMRKTGLAWIQIYKWYFDHKVKKEKLMRAYQQDYPFAIFKVEGPDGRERTRPLFTTEKVVRTAQELLKGGKPLF